MVYVVEDDDNIRELVVYTLNSTGIPAKGFPVPSLFRTALVKEMPDLVMLDLMLPEEDGLSILESLRKNPLYASLPIILLTAKGTEYDKVIGFEKGADDYIPKPFGMMELVARVKALLRRSRKPENEPANRKLTVNQQTHTVLADGREVTLTLKEFELLSVLLQNENTVLTRDQLLNAVWGYEFDGESRTLDVHIRTLRQKLGDCGSLIETVRGVGYSIRKRNS